MLNTAQSLDSTPLHFMWLSTPSYWLSWIKSGVAKEEKPGYLTRLDTLTELKKLLAAKSEDGVR